MEISELPGRHSQTSVWLSVFAGLSHWIGAGAEFFLAMPGVHRLASRFCRGLKEKFGGFGWNLSIVRHGFMHGE
jgi:hypothetical protein